MEHRCNKEGEIAGIQEKLIGISKRVDKVEDSNAAISQLAQSMAVLAEQMRYLSDDVKSVKGDVEEIKGEDGNTWKNFKWILISGIVGIVFGILTRFVG